MEKRFALDDADAFKSRLLNWAAASGDFCWLDSNGHPDPLGRFDGLLGIGRAAELQMPAKGAFRALSDFREQTGDWIMGYLGYDLKNDLEALDSRNPDRMKFPDLYVFQPEKLIEVRRGQAVFRYLPGVAGEAPADWQAIADAPREVPETPHPRLRTRMGVFKEAYFRAASKLLAAIQRGDFYEVTFCQEFYVEDAQLDVAATYRRLNAISRPPFAAWLQFGTRSILSASPERYLCKRGDTVWSQPMKGTARRDPSPEADRQLGLRLQADPKERAENIMIADLVRNDLSRSARKGSVRVDGLCELKTYEQVHQLISTIRAGVPQAMDPVQLLRDTFPMGSMTGAPKISAMQHIECRESFKRGAYSGALGYMTPEGDFDFNVLIRSLLYDSSLGVATFPVGGALTAAATPAAEYEECLLKARAMRKVLEGE